MHPGETVLFEGTGGVSTSALQFAKAAGARVIATLSSDEKLAQARRLGADEVINYRATPEWGARATDIADGGVDHVGEVCGPETLDQALAAVRYGGEVALVGVLTGFAGPINTGAILMKAVNLRGVYVGSVADLRGARVGRAAGSRRDLRVRPRRRRVRSPAKRRAHRQGGDRHLIPTGG